MKKTKTNKNQESNITVNGTLQINRNGMGFVTVDGYERDILIKAENLGVALDGDKVSVAITRSTQNGRVEGRITKVLERRYTDYTGNLEVKKHFAFLIPDKENIPVDIYVPLHLLHDGKNGDKVVVRIVEWEAKSKNPIGEVIKILTGQDANESAMQSILMDAGFPLDFPENVLEEAERCSPYIDKEALASRKDLRNTLTFTIDPVDAKDFDDAISFKRLRGGYYEIGVHIADVSHFVTPNSELDKEAYKRATSVYLPDRVLPMLPEELSNTLCSLRPNEDKYTFSAIFKINKKGNVKEYWLGRTIIRSQRRFTYEDVQEIIEGADGDHKDDLLLINEIAQNLRATRFEKGAINFSSQEVRFKLDENAKPIEVVVKESKEAHKLIEEFMLLANRTVAQYINQFEINDKPVPFPYRVHDQPNEEKLSVFSAFAARYGYKFNLSTPETIATSFNEMLLAAKGKPEQHVLESLGIRTMAKAVYTTDNIGHYGLGFEYYCHFTSPIRRYPDILAHRVLQECLDDAIKPVKHMEQMCRHSSEQERRAMEAERAANKYKQVEYIQQYLGEEFDAVISGIAAFGIWAETIAHKCEGMIPMSELTQLDDFILKEAEYTLVGRGSGVKLRIGDKIRVKVLSANLDRRQIDYQLITPVIKPQRNKQQKKQKISVKEKRKK